MCYETLVIPTLKLSQLPILVCLCELGLKLSAQLCCFSPHEKFSFGWSTSYWYSLNRDKELPRKSDNHYKERRQRSKCAGGKWRSTSLGQENPVSFQQAPGVLIWWPASGGDQADQTAAFGHDGQGFKTRHRWSNSLLSSPLMAAALKTICIVIYLVEEAKKRWRDTCVKPVLWESKVDRSWSFLTSKFIIKRQS